MRKKIDAVIAPVLLLVVWEAASRAGLVNRSILPAPSQIAVKLWDLLKDGKLLQNLGISIRRVAQGFLIGSILGLLLGTWMGLAARVNRILGSLVGILRPVPMVAWIPLLILWAGIGEGSKVAVIIIGTFWPVLLNTIQGIQSTDKKLLEVAQVLEKDKRTVLLQVVLPGALSSILTGLRLGIGTAWSCVVAAEMIAASKGIGYMIMYAREMSQPSVIFVGVFVIGAIGLLIDKCFLKMEHFIFRWK
jgi:sulfonate transport system permease protein